MNHCRGVHTFAWTIALLASAGCASKFDEPTTELAQDPPEHEHAAASADDVDTYAVALIASTPASLPNCKAALSGTVARVDSPPSLWACKDGSWRRLSARPMTSARSRMRARRRRCGRASASNGRQSRCRPDRRGRRDRKAKPAPLVRKDPRDRRAIKVRKDLRVRRARKVRQGPRVIKAHRARLDRRAKLVRRAPRVSKALPDATADPD